VKFIFIKRIPEWRWSKIRRYLDWISGSTVVDLDGNQLGTILKTRVAKGNRRVVVIECEIPDNNRKGFTLKYPSDPFK